MIKLMYITNRPSIAKIVETAGVDRIFIDMESLGKQDRQGGLDTVQSHHTFSDISNIRSVLTTADLLVRCNPIHDACAGYCGSAEEIDTIIDNGADIVMLPYFHTPAEAAYFIEKVGGRAKTDLLIETPEAVAAIDEILALPGVDEIHIGLNDLSMGYHKKFMFELFSDGTVERICEKCRAAGIPYGIGGIASLGRGTLPAEYIIKEHYRLGTTAAILSRSFCNANRIANVNIVRRIFSNGVQEIREFEKECALADTDDLMENKKEMDRIIQSVVEK